MPVEPHRQMHTGVEQHGTFGALPEISIAGTQSTGVGVCAHTCANNRLVHHKNENGSNAGD